MKKINLNKLFLLMMSTMFSFTISFSHASTTDMNTTGVTNFNAASTHYQFNSEVGAPAVEQSRSFHYIFDHGAYWNQYTPAVPSTPNAFSGVALQLPSNLVINNNLNQTSSSSNPVTNNSVNTSPSNLPEKALIYKCDSGITCTSIAVIREIDLITQPSELKQLNPVVASKNIWKSVLNLTFRNLIYFLISIFLILLIIILLISLERINHRYLKSKIKNRYD